MVLLYALGGTLPPIIMEVKKWVPLIVVTLQIWLAIFHFHDYGRKSRLTSHHFTTPLIKLLLRSRWCTRGCRRCWCRCRRRRRWDRCGRRRWRWRGVGQLHGRDAASLALGSSWWISASLYFPMCSMGLVYVPTWMDRLNGKLVGKYSIHGVSESVKKWEIQEPNHLQRFLGGRGYVNYKHILYLVAHGSDRN